MKGNQEATGSYSGPPLWFNSALITCFNFNLAHTHFQCDDDNQTIGLFVSCLIIWPLMIVATLGEVLSAIKFGAITTGKNKCRHFEIRASPLTATTKHLKTTVSSYAVDLELDTFKYSPAETESDVVCLTFTNVNMQTQRSTVQCYF